MSLNWKEIQLILDELQPAGAFIRNIRQPDFSSLLMSLYHPAVGRTSLLISLEAGKTRIHRVEKSLPQQPKGQRPQRFVQFLRSRIEGGRITGCRQVGQERIIELCVERGGETTLLFIRLWSGAANIIAADEQLQILDAYYRRPARGEVSGGKFNLPPHDPNRQQGTGRNALIPESFSGFPDPGKQTGRDCNREYSVRDRNPEISFNLQIEGEYSDGQSGKDDHQSLTEEAEKIFSEKEMELKSALRSLQSQREEAEAWRSHKETADLLAAHAHLIKPGASSIDIREASTGDLTRILLNPRLGAGQQVDAYYRTYRKALGAARHLDEEIAAAERQITELKQKRNELLIRGASESMQAAEHIARLKEFIAAVHREQQRLQLKSSGRSGSSGAGKNQPPGLQFTSGPFTILVGRSAAENDQLLRSFTRGGDYWLHTRDVPGGYVFIKAIKGRSIPLETLLDAGNLALFFSKGRNGGKGELYCTQVKYLRRAKDGPQGKVLPTQEKNLSITLDRKRLDRLLSGESATSPFDAL